MKLAHALLLAFAVFAGIFAGSLLAARDAAEPSESVRTVDIARILDEFEPFRASFQVMLAKYQPEQDRLRKLADSIKSQRGELTQMDQKSEQFRIQSFQVNLLEKTHETEAEFWVNALQRDRENLLRIGVTRVHEACAEYGRRTGVGVVMMKPGTLPLPTETANSALRDLESRWVIWSNTDHDVTDAVIGILREQR